MDSAPDPAAPPSRPLLDHAELHWFESDDGPAVFGFRLEGAHSVALEVDWHHHVRAQLVCVEQGLLTIRTLHGTWSLPAGSGGWMPPAEPHTIAAYGPLRGWGMAFATPACRDLPDAPCVIEISPLLHAMAKRLCTGKAENAPRQQRLLPVLQDEIRHARQQRMHLPLPRDRRLRRIASQLLADPADGRSLEQWAQWAGLSPRSLTRYFREETTLSFAQWRQQARLAEALRQLSDGRSVADIAHALGFSSSSAFVTVFRRHFGLPPGRYLARAGRDAQDGAFPARGLASPPASG